MTKKEIKEMIREIEEVKDDIKALAVAIEKDDEQEADEMRDTIDEYITDICIPAIEDLMDEYQEKFDDLSERAQEGPRGDDLQDKISSCENAISQLDECMNDDDRDECHVTDAVSYLQDIL